MEITNDSRFRLCLIAIEEEYRIFKQLCFFLVRRNFFMVYYLPLINQQLKYIDSFEECIPNIEIAPWNSQGESFNTFNRTALIKEYDSLPDILVRKLQQYLTSSIAYHRKYAKKILERYGYL